MKHAANFFWGGVLGVAVLALVAGFFSGRSLQRAGAMPVAMQVTDDAPVQLARSLVGARGRDAQLEPFDAPIEDAVVDRPEGWAPRHAPPQGDVARLAIVICGIGIDDTLDRRFAQIPYPLTFAVPANGDPPAGLAGQTSDPRALVVDADGARSIDQIAARLEQVHAGGVITQLSGHPAGSSPLVRRMQSLHAFVVDGMAGGASVFYDAAREDHVRAASRDIVLDAYDEEGYVTYMLRQAVRLARRTGVAIAVAHATPETFDALRSRLEGVASQSNVEIVPVGELVR